MPAGKTYIKIASQTLASTSASVTFSNLPQNYTDLVLVFQFELSQTDNIRLQFNGDTGNNYSFTALFGDGSSAQSNRGTSTSGIGAGFDDSSGNITRVNIQNYSNSSTFKTCVMRTDSATYTVARVGMWRNTNPITSIRIYGENGSTNINSGSIFTIYGIECAKNPYAEGGDKVYTTGTHWVHEFYNSGLFVPRQNLTADYLVVAGGGGGGSAGQTSGRGAGGGGAGGYRNFTNQSLSANTGYAITVGAGGARGASGGFNNGAKGGNSSFASTSSTGGGFGAAQVAASGNGGSGGGGSNLGTAGTGNEGGYSPVEGYNGGAATTDVAAGSGGGGSSAAGTQGGTDTGGAGGAGTSNSITGTSITYAAGGRGGDRSNTNSGANGSSNTGNGGGGGDGSNSQANAGGSGGSGIVIVRYPV